MKILPLYESINAICKPIKLTKEVIDEVNQYSTDEALLRGGGLSIEALDRLSFGFSAEDIKTLIPKQLNIKWKEDWNNVKWEHEQSGLSRINFAKSINLTEPIDVVYEKGRFFVDDGHHRTYAAKILNKPLNVNLEIKDNPITKLGYDDYDLFHRCLFKQVKDLV